MGMQPLGFRDVQASGRESGPAGLAEAKVLSVLDEVTADAKGRSPRPTVFLEIDGESKAGRQAASCLLALRPGDLVLCALTPRVTYVLHVLERAEAGPACLSAPDARALVLKQEHIAIEAEELSASAGRTRVRSADIRVVAKTVAAVSESVSLVAEWIKRVAGRETVSVADAVHTARGTYTVQAESILQEASAIMSARSELTVIDAKSDVRVNAERISMG